MKSFHWSCVFYVAVRKQEILILIRVTFNVLCRRFLFSLCVMFGRNYGVLGFHNTSVSLYSISWFVHCPRYPWIFVKFFKLIQFLKNHYIKNCAIFLSILKINNLYKGAICHRRRPDACLRHDLCKILNKCDFDVIVW